MLIDSNAPVVVTAEIRIAASPEVVWDAVTEVEKWPTWHPAIRSVVADKAPGLDMTFRWRPGPFQIESTVKVFDPQKSIGWTGRAPGIAARHIWTIRPIAQGAVGVRTDESMTGLLPRLMRRQLRKSVQSDLDSWLRNLKTEAERRAAS